jgi:hypothetical protein
VTYVPCGEFGGGVEKDPDDVLRFFFRVSDEERSTPRTCLPRNAFESVAGHVIS